MDEIRRLCEPLLAGDDGIGLHLSGVAFIGGDGVPLFRCIRQDSVTLVNCCALLAEQLKG